MKKVRLILAGGACLLAGAGVFANSLVVLQFYQSATPTIPSCSTPYLGTVCPSGDGAQCSVVDEDSNVLWISQKESTGTNPPCVIRKKP